MFFSSEIANVRRASNQKDRELEYVKRDNLEYRYQLDQANSRNFKLQTEYHDFKTSAQAQAQLQASPEYATMINHELELDNRRQKAKISELEKTIERQNDTEGSLRERIDAMRTREISLEAEVAQQAEQLRLSEGTVCLHPILLRSLHLIPCPIVFRNGEETLCILRLSQPTLLSRGTLGTLRKAALADC